MLFRPFFSADLGELLWNIPLKGVFKNLTLPFSLQQTIPKSRDLTLAVEQYILSVRRYYYFKGFARVSHLFHVAGFNNEILQKGQDDKLMPGGGLNSPEHFEHFMYLFHPSSPFLRCAVLIQAPLVPRFTPRQNSLRKSTFIRSTETIFYYEPSARRKPRYVNELEKRIKSGLSQDARDAIP